jgi:hypothetical protein
VGFSIYLCTNKNNQSLFIMTITLITQEVYNNLVEIYNKYPKLTLQNKGYEYIRKDNLNNEELTKLKEVETILKQVIKGFSSFSNFRTNNKTQELQIRFQYDYSADAEIRTNPFIGVGYLYLEELLNGFRKVVE